MMSKIVKIFGPITILMILIDSVINAGMKMLEKRIKSSVLVLVVIWKVFCFVV